MKQSKVVTMETAYIGKMKSHAGKEEIWILINYGLFSMKLIELDFLRSVKLQFNVDLITFTFTIILQADPSILTQFECKCYQLNTLIVNT